MKVSEVRIGMRVRRTSSSFVGESMWSGPPGSKASGVTGPRRIGVIITAPTRQANSSHHQVRVRWESASANTQALEETILVQRLVALPPEDQPSFTDTNEATP